MPDRNFDHRKESVEMKTAIWQIEEQMQVISQAAEDKIAETVRRWRDEQAARASGKGMECNPQHRGNRIL